MTLRQIHHVLEGAARARQHQEALAVFTAHTTAQLVYYSFHDPKRMPPLKDLLPRNARRKAQQQPMSAADLRAAAVISGLIKG